MILHGSAPLQDIGSVNFLVSELCNI